MKPSAKTLAVLLLAIAFVAFNFLTSAVPARIDATAGKIYTLSPGTQSLLSRLEEPVKLEFYYSRHVEGLPISFKNYADRIQEMLRQYVRTSRGKIELSIIDPKSDTPAEEAAQAAGLSGQPAPNGESVFLGLLAIQGEQQKSIPFLSPQREAFLEYDLSQLVHEVQQWKKRKVGLLSTVPLQAPFDMAAFQRTGRPAPNQFIMSEWERTFELVPVQPSAAELPADLDALVVVHPSGLSDDLQFAIDQYVLAGKPLFLCVDPASRQAMNAMRQQMMMGPQGQMGGGLPPSSNLPRLLSAWGIDYAADKVTGDVDLATPVGSGMGDVNRFATWMSLPKSALNTDALPTSSLDSMLMVDAGALAPKPGNAATFTALIETTAGAGEIDAASIQFTPPDEAARKLAVPHKRTLAALVHGKFKTAFPDGKPSASTPASAAAGNGESGENEKEKENVNEKEKEKDAPASKVGHITESKTSSTVLVVADTDWLFDDYSVRRINFPGMLAAEPINDNLAFASNALEYLAGSPDLISLRGKGTSLRPFTVVRAMEADAQRRYEKQLEALETRIEEVQKKLTELRGQSGEGTRLVASPEVRQTIEEFQEQQTAMRSERRQIRAALREGIEALETKLLLTNLLVPPLLVGLFGLWFQSRRRASR